MSRGPSRVSLVAAIVLKDLREFAGDKMWLTITPLGLASMIIAFWVLPSTVDETVSLGISPQAMAEPLDAMFNRGDAQQEEAATAIELIAFDNEAALTAAIAGEEPGEDGEEPPDLSMGLAFADDFSKAIVAGEPTRVTLVVDGTMPEPFERAMASEAREIAWAYQASSRGGHPRDALPVSLPERSHSILGEDRAGNQVPLRERMRPMLALLVLMIGSIGLAGLVAVEIEQRTVTALLVTPVRTADLLAAKGLTGAVLAMGQALVFVVATWSFGESPLLVLTLMLLGSVMMSAIGMIAGAAGRDFMSTMFYGFALIVPLLVPAFSVLLPGSAALWIRLLPSYGLTEALIRVVGYGWGWGEVLPHLGATLGWLVVLFLIALSVLKRRVEAP